MKVIETRFPTPEQMELEALKPPETPVVTGNLEKSERCLHFIWLGDKPLPDYANKNMARWRELMPTWEQKLWTSSNLLKLHNIDAFIESDNFGEASDILRYEIIFNQGGAPMDLDILPLADFEPAIKDVGAWLGFGRRRDNEEGNYAENAAIGGYAGHPFWRMVVDNLDEWRTNHLHEGTLVRTGPRFLQAQVAAWFGSGYSMLDTAFTDTFQFGDVRALPYRSFYLTHSEAMTTQEALDLFNTDPQGIYGIHECAGTWWK